MDNKKHSHGLVLDLGGVITLDQDPACFSELAREFEIPVSRIIQEMASLRGAYDNGSLGPEEYWSRILQSLAAASPEPSLKGLDPDTLMERYFEWGYTADFLSWSRPRAEIHDLASDLLEKGSPIGIISNMPRTLDIHFVQTWPWLAKAKPALYSGVLKLAKPDPSIYERFISESGLGAESLLFVDDRKENLPPAAALGMKTLHFTGSPENLQAIRDWMD